MDSFELSPDTFNPGVLTRPDHSPYHIPPEKPLEEDSAPVSPADAGAAYDGFRPAPAPRQATPQGQRADRAAAPSPSAAPQTATAASPQSAPRQQRRERPAPASSPRQAQPQGQPSVAAQAGHTRGFDRTAIRTALRLFTGSRMVKFIGILLTVVAVYLLISAISYFSNGAADQSIALHQSLSEAASHPEEIGNAGGPVGAKVSHMLIADMFGIASFILIYYIGALGINMVGWHKFRFWKLSFRCFMSTVALSVLSGFVTFGLTSSFSMGGTHGYYVNKLLLDHIGIWGAIGVNVILVSAVLLIFLNELQSLYGLYRRRREAYKEKMERRRAEIEARRIHARQELARTEAERQAREAAAAPPVVNITPEDLIVEDSALSEAALVSEVSAPIPIEASALPADPRFEPAPAPARQTSYTPDSVVSPRRPDEPAVALASAENNNVEPQQSQEPQQLASAPAAAAPSASSAPPVASVAGDVVMTVQTTAIETVEDASDGGSASTASGPVLGPNGRPLDPRDQPLYDPTAELSRYKFPGLDLLHEGNLKTNVVDIVEQERNKEQIISALKNYGIEISSITATVGPTITLYEIVPAQGVRIAQIKRLEDDIALTLRALGIRIIAPIPGKGTVGIEVPNNDPQIVPMRAILASKKFHESTALLPMAVGATISNDVFIADLTKMPHLLVAGATGQGKSVGLNAILASLLYKKHPSELKLVLVDPKQLEFSLYGQIERHYLAKLPDAEKAIITDMTKVVPTLNSLCIEMENRYTLLTEAGVRNIGEYNQVFRQHRLSPDKGHRFLPYIVVVIDEFADLIMTQGKEVENPISRIAAKARAAGIHMILATQRPSTNIITGVIKANFPGRMAFRVTQMVDSRTIIDRPGANQLIGRGDMLFSRDGVIDRVQCAFIDTDEVKAICSHIASQPGPDEAYILPEYDAPGETAGGMASVGDRDPLFEDAGRVVIESGLGSTSNLQRRYNIGYPRAGKIMDQLEHVGVVGPTQGGKPRQVLMDSLQFERLLESLGIN